MQVKDLIPWGRRKEPAASNSNTHPVATLQRDITRVFDDFWANFDRPFGLMNGFFGGAWPTADVSETDKAVEVVVELPGMDEKDIDVTVTDDVLTIRGEKKSETEKKEKGYFVSERNFGSFHRSIPLPAGVDTDKVDARFKKGVLTVTLPKTAEAQDKVKKISVRAA
ncbi:MAG: Hsp20/alpha crystallin family protein [Rhizobiaceae bacterium]